jgi:hypothetical protein
VVSVCIVLFPCWLIEIQNSNQVSNCSSIEILAIASIYYHTNSIVNDQNFIKSLIQEDQVYLFFVSQSGDKTVNFNVWVTSNGPSAMSFETTEMVLRPKLNEIW